MTTHPATSAPIDTALTELRAHFGADTVTTTPDGSGGVYAVISDLTVGPAYTPAQTWLGFQISAAHPDADIYPHYTGMLNRTDGQPHGQAIQPVTWQGRPSEPALQISRRSNQRNPAVDTPVNKALRMILALLIEQ
ncbi:hypothetical protein J8N05_46430 (plasmid) [Streptomyces sp. BH-SS-21]|uniref:Uncharacterized protein n=1 Tax=Streptomyces liliiviolaceus TaxID=2823109 RepID=A0A940Y2V3_9ACTN|nr:hypothetical protein [Streptomyces liliiviolaceus]MBQ0855602.1 hypothetical protein [Streptomyces liliiviolaceus]